jgi:hypothetical protein
VTNQEILRAVAEREIEPAQAVEQMLENDRRKTGFFRWLFVALGFLTALICLPASAQEYDIYRLPEGRRCSTNNGTFQCYNLEEYRELLHIDEDLRLAVETHTVDLERIAQLTLAAEELRIALTSAESNITLLEAERTRLRELWNEENRLRHEAEAGDDLAWLPWTLAGGFAISTVILALIVGLQ